ncbi:hypothetical protein ECG_04099 [Echinococcus granulosus]|nr:hypothetical protein ECG_04099 [Echinococcus granulosus]
MVSTLSLCSIYRQTTWSGLLYPRRRMPLWIKNGQICVVGSIVSIFTIGYFFFLAMIYAPRCVRPPYSPLPTSVFP